MRKAVAVMAAVVWVLCWVVAPASWWLNERILNEQAFTQSMEEVLGLHDVDTQIANRISASIMDNTRGFVDRTVPFLSPEIDVLLDRAQPTVDSVVAKAVNSQPGQRAMLEMSTQTHNAFVAWLHGESLGQPGLQADLDSGRATLDVDQLLSGRTVSLGPVTVPLDALDLPGISVPVPLPPDWMRVPLNLVRSAFWPAVIGIVISAGVLAWSDRWRLRAVGIAAAVTAAVCAITALVIRSSWTLSGADSADWTLTRAIGELMIRPWLTAYVWVIGSMILVAAAALLVDRRRVLALRAAQ